MNKKLLTAVALAATPLFAAGFASNAIATVELKLSSGASTPVLIGAACATDTCVSYSGTVGGWVINITGGTSAGPGDPTMDLESIDATATSGSAAPLDIELSDNGFSVGSSLFSLVSSGHTFFGSGTATYSAYFDTGNTDFAETALIGTLGPFSGAYATGTTGAGTTGTPYSLTEHVVLTADVGGVKWSTDSSITPVPEPASLVLLTSQLVGLGWLGRRRRKAA